MYFLQFRNYLPLEKGGALYLNKLESPSPKDVLCQFDPEVLEKKMKMWKLYDSSDAKDDNDNGKQINFDQKAHLSLRLRWAKIIKLILLICNDFLGVISSCMHKKENGTSNTWGYKIYMYMYYRLKDDFYKVLAV